MDEGRHEYSLGLHDTDITPCCSMPLGNYNAMLFCPGCRFYLDGNGNRRDPEEKCDVDEARLHEALTLHKEDKDFEEEYIDPPPRRRRKVRGRPILDFDGPYQGEPISIKEFYISHVSNGYFLRCPALVEIEMAQTMVKVMNKELGDSDLTKLLGEIEEKYVDKGLYYFKDYHDLLGVLDTFLSLGTKEK